MNTAQEILDILDGGAEAAVFPMLDHPYVSLAAIRLSLYRSEADWALVFESFGFSRRAGVPDLSVTTFAGRLCNRNPATSYPSPEAYQGYLSQHPHDETRFFYPVAASGWQDPTNDAIVAEGATEVALRGALVGLPTLEMLVQSGVTPSRRPRILVSEVCRFLAETRRVQVLGTEEERGVSVPTGLEEILRLDEWTHPDIAAEKLPSHMESFQQIAGVLASGNPALFRPTTPSNTHWSNWPDGGRG